MCCVHRVRLLRLLRVLLCCIVPCVVDFLALICFVLCVCVGWLFEPCALRGFVCVMCMCLFVVFVFSLFVICCFVCFCLFLFVCVVCVVCCFVV